MKIALAQLNYHIGNFEANTSKIIGTIKKAREQKAELIVFSELSVCGYFPKDLLDYPWFIEKCRESVELIASHCIGIDAIVGAPSVNPQQEGKDLYNSAWFLSNGKIQNIRHKTLLPTYDVFDEYRYFEPNHDFRILEYKGVKIALTICEDLWNIDKNPLYRFCPMDKLMIHNPDLMINISASPFGYNHKEIRKNILKANSRQYNLPLIYVNQVGAHTELIFDGGSLYLNREGEIMEELNYFDEDLRIIEFNNPTKKNEPKFKEKKQDEIQLIHDALVLGIRDYFTKSGIKNAILGSSGGIDSAVVNALAVEALGSDRVRVCLLPSQYSSEGSVNDARKLAENLGVHADILHIQNPVDEIENTLSGVFGNLHVDVTEENIQARVRGVLLMAMSNKFGHMVLNTSNKSEMAVGYGTLYGDMCGGISVLGDLYKTRVYELANYINRDREIIPREIIEKAPSAELRPDQKDSDSLPEYDILDKILFQYIEERKGVEEIIAHGFDASLVNRIVKMVNFNEYKRYQAPPILRVSSKAFGSGRRMPIVAKFL